MAIVAAAVRGSVRSRLISASAVSALVSVFSASWAGSVTVPGRPAGAGVRASPWAVGGGLMDRGSTAWLDCEAGWITMFGVLVWVLGAVEALPEGGEDTDFTVAEAEALPCAGRCIAGPVSVRTVRGSAENAGAGAATVAGAAVFDAGAGVAGCARTGVFAGVLAGVFADAWALG